MEEDERTYDTAEATSSTEMTLAQWARGQAVVAIMSGRQEPIKTDELSDRVHAIAELIIMGGLPRYARDRRF